MSGGPSTQARKANRGARFLALLVLALFAVSTFGRTQTQSPINGHGITPYRASAPSLLQQAERLVQMGNLDEAQKLVEEQMISDPSSVEAYNLEGIICTAKKDYVRAIDAFERALELAPNSTKSHNDLGNLYVTQQKLDLAQEEFAKVLRIAPADRDANYNLGLLLLGKGNTSAAIQHFQRVRPATVESQFNLVRAYFQAGRTAEALQTARNLSTAHKQDVQLHFTLGVVLATATQYKAAQLELEQANALQPETFETLYNLGRVYLRGHDYTKAEPALTRALKLKPESAETLYVLAQVYSEEERPMDAINLLVRAHKLAPQNTDVIFLMARISMTQNYFEDAIPLLESGVTLSPQRGDLHAALGESYFMTDRTEKAIEEFQRLIDLDPSARSYSFMGLSYRRLGRFDDALKYFEEGQKKDPHNTSCLFNIGYIAERQGNYGRAEELFQQALRSKPDFPDALLELANLRSKDKKFAEAAELLRKFVKVSRNPADGYYKLAMAERSLHQTAAAQRDLNVFQTLSKEAAPGPYPYQHLFDYLETRSQLSSKERTELDVSELTEQIQKHPGQPQDLYLLAETYLKLGRLDAARETVAKLDQLSAADFRTQTGVGVLFARYQAYDDAIQHFQAALRINPESDDVKFNLAAAYFRKGVYADALTAAQKVSPAGQDDAYMALLGDIEAHVGEPAKAMEIFRNAINRNPDNDQYYLSLALLQLRANDLSGAEQTLQKGFARVPGSGKLVWGQGLISVLRGNGAQAGERLERAVELLPEWVGSYSTLGVFYFQTGQIEKAREVLDRFKGSNAGGLNVERIEETLSNYQLKASRPGQPIPMVARQQVLQLALLIADRSL